MLAHCRNCADCFWCVNLINAQYCFLNEQLTKEQYKQKIAAINLGSRKVRKEWLAAFEKHINKYPKPSVLQRQTEQVLWNLVERAKDGFMCFEGADFEHCRYCTDLNSHAKYCMDYSVWGEYAERIYASITVGENASNIYFSVNCRPDVTNLFYCEECVMCKDCFGCVWLKNKQYCILNTQYTKDEYFLKVSQIITSMQTQWERWRFLPRKHAPFAYNESTAHTHISLSKKQALQQWYRWQDNIFDINIWDDVDIYDEGEDDIAKVSDDICKKAMRCPVSQRLFKIIPLELQFYKKYHIPLPIHHSDTRFYQNFTKRPWRDLLLRKCDKTGEQILSVYPESVPFKVYSQEAYNQEVYG